MKSRWTEINLIKIRSKLLPDFTALFMERHLGSGFNEIGLKGPKNRDRNDLKWDRKDQDQKCLKSV